MKKNLWILTEERPKDSVLTSILRKFCQDHKIGFFANKLRILPVLECDGRFSFTYSVIGFDCTIIDQIFIKTVSGNSSFTDFLIFYQNHKPTIHDIPIYANDNTWAVMEKNIGKIKEHNIRIMYLLIIFIRT